MRKISSGLAAYFTFPPAHSLILLVIVRLQRPIHLGQGRGAVPKTSGKT
jgi:hypothetical protein